MRCKQFLVRLAQLEWKTGCGWSWIEKCFLTLWLLKSFNNLCSAAAERKQRMGKSSGPSAVDNIPLIVGENWNFKGRDEWGGTTKVIARFNLCYGLRASVSPQPHPSSLWRARFSLVAALTRRTISIWRGILLLRREGVLLAVLWWIRTEGVRLSCGLDWTGDGTG